MINLQKFSEDLLAIREKSPLVVNITNYVAMNINANALLAIGASPIMSFYAREMDEMLTIAGALVVNIGCLDDNEIDGMRAAVSAASRHGKPWVLDPVGAGASRVRTATALELIDIGRPAIIRGNASEIICLNNSSGNSKGVDSTAASQEALPHAIALAKHFGCVVSVSGATDYITDGTRVETITNGSPMMSKITAMGCTASAVTGAFAAVSEPFEAAFGAMALMGVAGEKAAEGASGTGSMSVRFMDFLSSARPEEVAAAVRQ